MAEKLEYVIPLDLSRVDVTNISGQLLNCKITAGDGTTISFLAHPGMTFRVTGFETLPKIDADYVLDRVSNKLN